MSVSAPAAPGKPAPTLEESRALLARSRLLGRVSAFIFLLAALTVVDALQSLMRHEFNSVDLIPGESVLLSGMLPVEAKKLEDLTFHIEGHDALSFKPVETYKGFWMGGHMWRAELAARQGAEPGRGVLTIVEIIKPKSDKNQNYDDRDRAILFGGQQNPALVFTVNVWATEAERRAANTSFVRRFTGLPAFGLAAGLVFFAILAGFANWRTYSRAEVALAAHGVFFIHGIKEQIPGKDGVVGQPGYKTEFALAGHTPVIGDAAALRDRNFTQQASGRIANLDRTKGKGFAFFPLGKVRPQYGWLVSLESGETARPGENGVAAQAGVTTGNDGNDSSGETGS